MACVCVCLTNAGEKLQDTDVDHILKYTETEEDLDGNIKYEGNCNILWWT